MEKKFIITTHPEFAFEIARSGMTGLYDKEDIYRFNSEDRAYQYVVMSIDSNCFDVLWNIDEKKKPNFMRAEEDILIDDRIRQSVAKEVETAVEVILAIPTSEIDFVAMMANFVRSVSENVIISVSEVTHSINFFGIIGGEKAKLENEQVNMLENLIAKKKFNKSLNEVLNQLARSSYEIPPVFEDIKLSNVPVTLSLRSEFEGIRRKNVTRVMVSGTSFASEDFSSGEEFATMTAKVTNVEMVANLQNADAPHNFLSLIAELSFYNIEDVCDKLTSLFAKGYITNPFTLKTKYGENVEQVIIKGNEILDRDVRFDITDDNFDNQSSKESAIIPLKNGDGLNGDESIMMTVIIDRFDKSLKPKQVVIMKKVSLQIGEVIFTGEVSANDTEFYIGKELEDIQEDNSVENVKIAVGKHLIQIATLIRAKVISYKDAATSIDEIKKLGWQMDGSHVIGARKVAILQASWLYLEGFNNAVIMRISKALKSSNEQELFRVSRLVNVLSHGKGYERANIAQRLNGFNTTTLEKDDNEMADYHRHGIFMGFANEGFKPYKKKQSNDSGFLEPPTKRFQLNESQNDSFQKDESLTKDEQEFFAAKEKSLAAHLEAFRARAVNGSKRILFNINSNHNDNEYLVINTDRLESSDLPPLKCFICNQTMDQFKVGKVDSPMVGRLMYRCNVQTCRHQNGALIYASDVLGKFAGVKK